MRTPFHTQLRRQEEAAKIRSTKWRKLLHLSCRHLRPGCHLHGIAGIELGNVPLTNIAKQYKLEAHYYPIIFSYYHSFLHGKNGLYYYLSYQLHNNDYVPFQLIFQLIPLCAYQWNIHISLLQLHTTGRFHHLQNLEHK